MDVVQQAFLARQVARAAFLAQQHAEGIAERAILVPSGVMLGYTLGEDEMLFLPKTPAPVPLAARFSGQLVVGNCFALGPPTNSNYLMFYPLQPFDSGRLLEQEHSQRMAIGLDPFDHTLRQRLDTITREQAMKLARAGHILDPSQLRTEQQP